MLDARTALPSAEGLPNIPTEVRDALDSYGNLCGDVVAATLDKECTPLGVADLIAARNRVKDELLLSIERWAKRQIRVTAEMSLMYAQHGLAEHRLSTTIYCLNRIIDTNKAVLEGGAL